MQKIGPKEERRFTSERHFDFEIGADSPLPAIDPSRPRPGDAKGPGFDCQPRPIQTLPSPDRCPHSDIPPKIKAGVSEKFCSKSPFSPQTTFFRLTEDFLFSEGKSHRVSFLTSGKCVPRILGAYPMSYDTRFEYFNAECHKNSSIQSSNPISSVVGEIFSTSEKANW